MYFYEQNFFFGNKYKFLNIKHEVVLNGNQNFFTNNGFVIFEDKIKILTALFLILIRLNRIKILLDDEIKSLKYVSITNHIHR